jgi:hypothetical protein
VDEWPGGSFQGLGPAVPQIRDGSTGASDKSKFQIVSGAAQIGAACDSQKAVASRL